VNTLFHTAHTRGRWTCRDEDAKCFAGFEDGHGEWGHYLDTHTAAGPADSCAIAIRTKDRVIAIAVAAGHVPSEELKANAYLLGAAPALAANLAFAIHLFECGMVPSLDALANMKAAIAQAAGEKGGVS